jgi:hypothetical protein
VPIVYGRDDQQRLITLTVTDPYSLDDVLSVIDRQAAEDTWGYAMLYDLQGARYLLTQADLKQIASRVQVVGAGRERGQVGMLVASAPDQFRMGMAYTSLIRDPERVEVLLTAAQRDDWLARNARRGP